MAKITSDDISSGYASTSALDANFDRIDTHLNDKVLYRNNPAGEANQMENDLDMNSNQIMNLQDATLAGDAVNLRQLQAASVETDVPSQTGHGQEALFTDGSVISWRGAIEHFETKADAVLATPVNGKIYYIGGDDGGVFKGVTGASAGTYSDNGGSYCGTVFIPTGGDGSAAWVRQYNTEIEIEWFVAPGGDIGEALNSIMDLSTSASFSDSVSITAGPGTFTCSTMWDIDKANTNSTITFRGSGISAGSSPSNGTIIDGSSMTSDVINGARTKDNYHISLSDFTVLAPSSYAGIRLGDQSGGHSPSHSKLQNIVVKGGAPGFELEFLFNGYINKLYSVLADGTGIRLDTLNATTCGRLTVRQAKGTWAMDIEKGLGVNYGDLYLESNNKSALRVGDDLRGSRINSIYTENNNTDNTQAYEILIADQTVAAEDTESCEIGALYLSPPANAYSTAQLAVEHGTGLLLGPLWGTSDPLFATVGSNVHNIVFRGWSTPSTESIDLSNCGSGSKFTFFGCNLNPNSLTYPSATSAVKFIGCDRLLHDEETLDVSADHSLLPHERNISVDTDAAARTITLPSTLVVSGEPFSVSNTGSSTNDVTVDTNGAETIQGAASTAVADGKSKMFIWNKDKAQWMIIAST